MSSLENRITTTARASAAVTDALGSLRPVAPAINQLAGPSLLHRTQELNVACWNVRTLLNTGSQCLTMRTLHRYQIDIACLSEVRLPSNGCRRIKIPEHDGFYTLYHSGPTDHSGIHGVATAIDRASRSLLTWKPINQTSLYETER